MLLGTLLFLTAVWQVSPTTQVLNRPVGALIKPQYCQPISVPRRETPSLLHTRIAIMADRQEALDEAALGWQKTGIPLVAFDGQRFLPAACSDDVGMFYIVPMLARILRIPLGYAVDIFLAGVVLISALSGAAGLMLVCSTPFGKIVALSAVGLLSFLALRIGDVYTIQSSAVLAFVPWVLFCSRRSRSPWNVLFIFVTSAVLISANLIRSQAGTPILIFMVWVFAFQLRATRQFKLLLAVAAMLGLLLPAWYSRSLLRARDTYLEAHGYTSVVGIGQHGFWHVIYLGLGYISNDVVPGYRDEFAAAKVRDIDPDVIYASPQYDDHLKHEVMHIVVQHPLLVIETLAAKIGVIACLILLCVNAGFVAACYFPKAWATEVAFWSAIAFQSLIGILAVPAKSYLLGLIATATLYGVVSIDEALQHGVIKRIELDLLQWGSTFAASSRRGGSHC